MRKGTKSQGPLKKEIALLRRKVSQLEASLASSREAEERFQKLQKRYRSLFENAVDVVYLVSRQRKIRAVNPAIKNFAGWLPGELIGKPFLDFFHPKDLSKVRERMRQILSGKRMPLSELRFRTKAGGYIFGEFSDQPWGIDDKVKGFFGIARDITARKQMEQKIQYCAKFDKLISNFSTYFINISLDQIKSGINYVLQELGGFLELDRCYLVLLSEDGTKMSVEQEWCAEEIEPEIKNLQNLPVKPLRWLIEPLKRQEVFHLAYVREFPLRSKTEKKFFKNQELQSLTCIPISYGKRLMGFLGLDSVRLERSWDENTMVMFRLIGEIFANLLERKRTEELLRESEEEYRKMFDAMSDMIHLVDQDLRFLLFNTAFKKMNEELGLNSEVIGKRISEVFPFLPEKVYQEYQKVISTGKPLITEEMTKVGGREFITETRKIPVLERGKVARVITVMRDITERKRMELSLQESREIYQALLNILPQSIVILDLEGNILDISRAGVRLHNYERKEELVGKSGYVLVAPEEKERLTEIGKKVFQQATVEDIEYVMLKKDGTRVKAVMSFSLLRDGQGKPKGFIGIAREL